ADDVADFAARIQAARPSDTIQALQAAINDALADAGLSDILNIDVSAIDLQIVFHYHKDLVNKDIDFDLGAGLKAKNLSILNFHASGSLTVNAAFDAGIRLGISFQANLAP